MKKKFYKFESSTILILIHFIDRVNFRTVQLYPDMWWILLLSCWPYPLSWSITWYPPIALNAMLGEQVDLVGAVNATSGWTRNTANNEDFNDAVNGSESGINPGQPPVINSVDREPLDEVERIEPRQWPGRPDILPTRSTAPFTTETSLSPRSPQPTTLAQRHPSTQRFLNIIKKNLRPKQ